MCSDQICFRLVRPPYDCYEISIKTNLSSHLSGCITHNPSIYMRNSISESGRYQEGVTTINHSCVKHIVGHADRISYDCVYFARASSPLKISTYKTSLSLIRPNNCQKKRLTSSICDTMLWIDLCGSNGKVSIIQSII